MDREAILRQIDYIMSLIGTANQYAAEENKDPIPSLWEIHNGNIFIAVRDLENSVKGMK